MEMPQLVLLTGAHILMTVLPGVAACLIMIRVGVRNVPVLLGSLLVSTGLAAMLAFWSFYADPFVGKVVSVFIQASSVAVVLWALRTRKFDSVSLREVATPVALWIFGTYFLVFLGFLHGGTTHAEGIGATRFNAQLPPDNDFPQFFSTWFYVHGHHGPPPAYPGDWTAGDRPPLQIGYVLMQRVFGYDSTGLNYDLIGVVIQQLWIIGLWALLKALRLSRTTRGLAALTVLVSDVAIVNGFFVWPKMIAAAFVLGAVAVVATADWSRVRGSYGGAILVASLVALSMLAHGGSAFGLIPLVIVALLRGLPSWRWLLIALITAAILYVPWSEYQKYGDPPANRVTKWQLAGQLGGNPTADAVPLFTAIRRAYASAGVSGTVHNKAENFVTLAGGGPMATMLSEGWRQLRAGRVAESVSTLREVLYYYPLPSLGPLVFVPFFMVAAWLRRRRRPREEGDSARRREWTGSVTLWAIVLIGVVAWSLILFGNSISTPVNWQGSYALPVLGLVAGVLGARALAPRFGTALTIVCATLSLAIYVPMFEPTPDSAYSPWAALIATISLGVFVVFAFGQVPRLMSLPRSSRLLTNV